MDGRLCDSLFLLSVNVISVRRPPLGLSGADESKASSGGPGLDTIGDDRIMRPSTKHQLVTRLALIAGALTFNSTSAYADNPIVQTSYTADPAPMVHEGTLYLYTSHDEDVTVSNFYTMNDWHLYSTQDMVNWTDLGTPASLSTFSWSTDSAWAPQGIARNGKYYLYLPINNNTGARIGVAVSDNIEGPFMDPLGQQLAAQGSNNIDPTVFIDSDDQAYMYWGNMTLRYVKLNADMISTSGPITEVDMPGFTEGPWFYKRESLYYLIFAATEGTEKIMYATSDSPTGPWTEKGQIMGPGNTFTNHAGVVDYKGHSYFFYHNSALPGGNDYKRSVCVEEFTYGSDGSIPALTMSQEGPDPVDTLNPFEEVQAETIAFSEGLKTEVCDDNGGGMNVRAINDGDYIKVRNVDLIDGVTSIDLRVAESKNDAKIEVHLDSESGTLLGECDVSGATAWTTTTCDLSGGSDVADLFLVFRGAGDELFKFNWWKMSGPTVARDGTGGAAGAGGDSGAGGGIVAGAGGSTLGSGGLSGAGGAAMTSSGGNSNITPGGGGTAAGSGGSAETTGGLGDQGPSGDETGCSCRIDGGQRRKGSFWAFLLAAGALGVSYRRRGGLRRS